MQELTLGTLFAVFEEMFGAPLFWAMVLVAALITVGYVYVLVRDRSVSWRKFLLAQLSMPVGAVLGVGFVLIMTNSGLSDIGGPIDVIVLLAVAAVGAFGMAVLVYTLEALIGSRRTREP
jgi:4-amino-4-deoxy-L-arabinose transferase-like glycosyltransferase